MSCPYQHTSTDTPVRKSDQWEKGGEKDDNWSATEAQLSIAGKDIPTKLQNCSGVGNSHWFLIAREWQIISNSWR